MTVPFRAIELETTPAPRLEIEQPLVVVAAPRRERSSLAAAATGVAVLGVGFSLLETYNFVAEEFSRGPILGSLTLGVAIAGFGLLGAGIGRELRGLFRIGRVDRLRAALVGDDVMRARHAARAWLSALPDAADILPAVEAADTVEAIRALLRAGPLNTLRLRTDALARSAAIQSFVATSAVPSPSLDGLFIAWRGLRLVREVAELHGLRPGTLGTLALLRRTAFSAAAVITTDVAVSTALSAVTSHPLLRHIAGDMAGAGIGARRLFLLARATALACSPVLGE